MEVKAAEFARMAGVNRAAISIKIKNGTLILNSGGKLDTDNPVNRAYLEKHNEKRKQLFAAQELQKLSNAQAGEIGMAAAPAATRAPASNAMPTPATDELFSRQPATRGRPPRQQTSTATSMLEMTLKQLILQYGDSKGIADYAKILRDLTVAAEREQKTQERRLVLIPKDFVTARLFGFYDQLMNKLLDVPEAVADQVIALALSAEDDTKRQNVINVLSDNLSRCISGCKEHVVSELNGLKGKYEKIEADSASALSELSEKIEMLEGR